MESHTLLHPEYISFKQVRYKAIHNQVHCQWELGTSCIIETVDQNGVQAVIKQDSKRIMEMADLS